jgi:hypothetical protein
VVAITEPYYYPSKTTFKDMTIIISERNMTDNAATLRYFFNISPSQVELDIRNAVEGIGEG